MVSINYREKNIVNTETSHMTVRHLYLEGTNFEIGKKLAEIAKQRHGFNPKLVSSSNPLITQARYEYFKKKFPYHYNRSMGVGAALNLDPTDFRFDTSRISYNMEFPSLPGCSVVYYPPTTTENGHGVLSRNFDFPLGTLPDMLGIQLPPEIKRTMRPMLGEPYIVEMHPEDGGYSSISISSFDLLSGVLDGINSEGLVASLNGDEIAMAQMQGGFSPPVDEVGIDESQILRLILETCSNGKEAKELLLSTKQSRAFLPCHFLIADSQGNSFVYEQLHDQNEEHIVEGDGLPQILTNHPLHTFPTVDSFPEYENWLEVGTSSFERHCMIAKQLEVQEPPYSQEFMEQSSESVSVSNLIHAFPVEYQQQLVASSALSRTLWHSLYDTLDRSLNVKFYLNEDKASNGAISANYSEYFEFTIE